MLSLCLQHFCNFDRIIAVSRLFACRLDMLFQKGSHLGFGQSSGKFIDHLALNHQLDGWQTANTELLGNCLLGFGVHLGQYKPPWYSSASFSSIGISVLHGWHQSAQKSIRTGCSIDPWRITDSKFSAVTSTIYGESDMVFQQWVRLVSDVCGDSAHIKVRKAGIIMVAED